MELNRARSIMGPVLGLALLLAGFAGARASHVAAASERVENPHFRIGRCDGCHPGGDSKKLTHKSVDDLCKSCHEGERGRIEVHPSDIAAEKGAVEKVPPEFPLARGTLTCSTCHDILVQCSIAPSTPTENPLFLRGGPYAEPWAICFRCHEGTRYDVFDPHHHRGDDGEILEAVCLSCHEPPPPGGEPDRIVGPHFDDICRSCHRIQPHPAGKDHMRKPSPRALAFIQRSASRSGLYLPLNSRDEVYCSTCHNPHEKDVLQAGDPKARGAEGDRPTEYRLRVLSPTLCLACHDMGTFKGNLRGKTRGPRW